MDTNTGRFVWYELMTTDPKAAIEFYGGLIGWKTQVFGDAPMEGHEPYNMWVGSQGPLGGVMTLAEEAKKMGAPPHWMANVTVADVDAAVKQVKEMGGQVYHGPMDIPTVGRFAVIGDPQGASISLFKPSGDMAPHDTSKQGEVSWNELVTTDHEAGFKFYSTLFGWERISEFDMGPMGKYLLYGKDGKSFGGMMTKTADMPMPSAWIYYIQVDDVDGTTERAKAKGAKLLHGPMDVPGGTRVSQLMDPQGAVFALHGPGNKPAA